MYTSDDQYIYLDPLWLYYFIMSPTFYSVGRILECESISSASSTAVLFELLVVSFAL
jgi:hypothetical protein